LIRKIRGRERASVVAVGSVVHVESRASWIWARRGRGQIYAVGTINVVTEIFWAKRGAGRIIGVPQVSGLAVCLHVVSSTADSGVAD